MKHNTSRVSHAVGWRRNAHDNQKHGFRRRVEIRTSYASYTTLLVGFLMSRWIFSLASSAVAAPQANLLMYTEEALKERKKLRASKALRAEVKAWWQGLGKDMVHGLTRDEYIGLYLNLAPVRCSPPTPRRVQCSRASHRRRWWSCSPIEFRIPQTARPVSNRQPTPVVERLFLHCEAAALLIEPSCMGEARCLCLVVPAASL